MSCLFDWQYEAGNYFIGFVLTRQKEQNTKNKIIINKTLKPNSGTGEEKADMVYLK